MHDHVRNWLYARWVEKEHLLSYFYKHHNFPTNQDNPEECSLRFPKLNYWSAILTQLAAFCTFYLLVCLYTYIF